MGVLVTMPSLVTTLFPLLSARVGQDNQSEVAGQKLLYEDGGTGYYGIPVPAGVQLREGAVADACEAAGMRAVCAGDSRCRWSSTRCQVVELESRLCGYTMYGLAEKICGNSNPRQVVCLSDWLSWWRMWCCGWQVLCLW